MIVLEALLWVMLFVVVPVVVLYALGVVVCVVLWPDGPPSWWPGQR